MTALLDPQASNFLAAIAISAGECEAGTTPAGIAWVDVSTGRFYAAAFAFEQFADHLARIGPAELLVSDDAATLPRDWAGDVAITRRQAWTFGRTAAIESLTKHFGTQTLEGFGFDTESDSSDRHGIAGGRRDSQLSRLKPRRRRSRTSID